MKFDRTIKILLTLIVILLTVLVLRPLAGFAPQAQAASSASASLTSNRLTRHQLEKVATITVPDAEIVRQVFAIQGSSNSFGVLYTTTNDIEIYAVNELTVVVD